VAPVAIQALYKAIAHHCRLRTQFSLSFDLNRATRRHLASRTNYQQHRLSWLVAVLLSTNCNKLKDGRSCFSIVPNTQRTSRPRTDKTRSTRVMPFGGPKQCLGTTRPKSLANPVDNLELLALTPLPFHRCPLLDGGNSWFIPVSYCCVSPPFFFRSSSHYYLSTCYRSCAPELETDSTAP